jgi:hypothetical protein
MVVFRINQCRYCLGGYCENEDVRTVAVANTEFERTPFAQHFISQYRLPGKLHFPRLATCLMLIALFLTLCGPVAASVTREQVISRTLEHIDALTNITAVQTMNNGQRYDVLILNGVQWYRQGKNYRDRLPRGDRGLFPGSEWYSMLRESLAWPLQGADGHYTFKALCMFGEIHHGKTIDNWYPCHGSVTTDAQGNIQSITKIIEPGTKLTQVATFTCDYKWARLSSWRLVPAALTANAKLSIGWFAVTAQWTDYREYRGTEPNVQEIDGPAVDAPLSGGSVINPAPVTGEDLGEPPPVPVLRPKDAPQRPATPDDLLKPDSGIKTTKETRKVSKWKELLRRTRVIKL